MLRSLTQVLRVLGPSTLPISTPVDSISHVLHLNDASLIRFSLPLLDTGIPLCM